MNVKVENICKILINDTEFLKRVENSLQNILSDGKVDLYDAPEIIFIIIDTYNSLYKFKLDSDDLPIIIKFVYNYIIENFNLIPSEKRLDFERLVDSGIKLLMIQPVIAKRVRGRFSCGKIEKNI